MRPEMDELVKPGQRARVDHEYQHAEKAAVSGIDALGYRDDRLSPKAPDHRLPDEQAQELVFQMHPEVFAVGKVDRFRMRFERARGDLAVGSDERRLDRAPWQRGLTAPPVKVEPAVPLGNAVGRELPRLDDIVENPPGFLLDCDGEVAAFRAGPFECRLPPRRYRLCGERPKQREHRAEQHDDCDGDGFGAATWFDREARQDAAPGPLSPKMSNNKVDNR